MDNADAGHHEDGVQDCEEDCDEDVGPAHRGHHGLGAASLRGALELEGSLALGVHTAKEKVQGHPAVHLHTVDTNVASMQLKL